MSYNALKYFFADLKTKSLTELMLSRYHLINRSHLCVGRIIHLLYEMFSILHSSFSLLWVSIFAWLKQKDNNTWEMAISSQNLQRHDVLEPGSL